MLHLTVDILLTLVFAYCALSVLYLFCFALAGRLFYVNRFGISAKPVHRIAVLVPAYREDGIIRSTAENLLRLDYPRELYEIFILADSFQPETIASLRQLPIQVLEVAFDKSTKTRALNEGFRRIEGHYDVALICDADNMLARDFLLRIDDAFSKGGRAVQGRRVAKNLDTSFAILDACSEAINNNIFRKGANALGLSSAVIGSGMAFEYERLRQILSTIDAVGGFDKPLQLKIVAGGNRIHYLEHALIFDEKVDSAQAFENQRKRWVSSQFTYLKRYFVPAFKQLFKGNVSYFNLAVGNNLVLPRAFLLLIMPLLVVATWLLAAKWALPFAALWVIYLLSLAIALPAQLVNRDFLAAVARLPRAIMGMVLALFHMKKAKQTFIHTVHTKTEVSNPLYNEHGH